MRRYPDLRALLRGLSHRLDAEVAALHAQVAGLREAISVEEVRAKQLRELVEEKSEHVQGMGGSERVSLQELTKKV